MGTTQDRLFFGSFVRLHILHRASKELISGVGVVAELNRHGYRLSPGKVYSVLQALERAGYLAVRFLIVCGKRRKYYQATGKGRRVVGVAMARLHDLASELVTPLPGLRENRSANQPKEPLEDSCDWNESDLL
jgi:DNA-binding PadR family transcriptional regulator